MSIGIVSSEIKPPTTRDVWFRVKDPTVVSKDSYVIIKDSQSERIYIAKIVEVLHKSDVMENPDVVSDIVKSGISVEEYWRGALKDPSKSYYSAQAKLVRLIEGQTVREPYIPPSNGSEVVPIDPEILYPLLKMKRKGLYIGKTYNNAVEVRLDPNRLMGGHCFICGQTWTGKSYMTGVLIEEALEMNIPVVVFDHYGEYETMKIKSEDEDVLEEWGLRPKGYRVMSFRPGIELKLNPYKTLRRVEGLRALNIEEGAYAQASLLRALIDSALAYGVKPNEFIEWALRMLAKIGKEEGYAQSTIEGLGWKLREVEHRLGVFGSGYDIRSLVRPGELTVINLKDIDRDASNLIVADVLSELVSARSKGMIKPCVAVVEEAHNYVPREETPSSYQIREAIRGGRHVGVGIWLVTQRPSMVHGDAISVCNTHIFLRLKGRDLDYVRNFASLDSKEIEDIMNLPDGVCLVTGPVVADSIKVKIRPRKSKHGGESVRFVET